MNKAGKKSAAICQLETKWLARELKKKRDESGLSNRSWLKSIGMFSNTGQVHTSYIFNGKRGGSFWMSIRLATAAGIDLSELQEIVRNKKYEQAK